MPQDAQKARSPYPAQKPASPKKPGGAQLKEAKRPQRPDRIAETQRPKRQPEPEKTQRAKRPAAKAVPKKKGKFRKAFLITWLAFSGLLIAALIVLAVFLSNFEQGRPTGVIAHIAELIEKGDLDLLHLKTADGVAFGSGEFLADPDEISAYIQEKTQNSEDGLTYRIINGESDETKKVYQFRAGDEKLLKVSVGRSEKKYLFGFTGWEEKETILTADAFQVTTLSVQIPQDNRLQINKTAIGREFITSEGDEISILSTLMDEGIIYDLPTMDTYQVPGIYFQKDVQAIDPSGAAHVCVLTGDVYTGGFDASEAFMEEHRDRVIDMFEPYAFYFSGESGRGALSAIMLDDSPAYNSAISADVSWMQEHSYVEITDQKADNFKQYSEDVFSCDIAFVQTIYQGDEPVKTWDTNMTWVFVKDGDDFYIADFVTKIADEG